MEKDIVKFRITEILEEKRLTMSWLRRETGLSSQFLCDALSGRVNFSMNSLVKVATALRVEMSDLFARTGWCDDVDEIIDGYTEVMREARKCRSSLLSCGRKLGWNKKKLESVLSKRETITIDDFKKMVDYLGVSEDFMWKFVKVGEK